VGLLGSKINDQCEDIFLINDSFRESKLFSCKFNHDLLHLFLIFWYDFVIRNEEVESNDIARTQAHAQAQHQTQLHSMAQVKKMPRLIDSHGKSHFPPIKTEIADT